MSVYILLPMKGFVVARDDCKLFGELWDRCTDVTPCVPSKTFLVFQTQQIPCAPSTTNSLCSKHNKFLVLQAQRILVFQTQRILCVPNTTNSLCSKHNNSLCSQQNNPCVPNRQEKWKSVLAKNHRKKIISAFNPLQQKSYRAEFKFIWGHFSSSTCW